ncbi:cytochrome P450 [Nonomuraea sp. MCN248]|uniref:Cytochrome P450 n=1 Tax=Nonomuraea corallina TaxID=2989783 RepID=A0ABT4S7G2_9ACTN|nr:cytochrome P450 [Nonomuraea corallina]MDA0633109.1 cytochrome P450 [Nonomuraea corallina]
MATSASPIRTLPFLSRLTKHHRIPVHALEEASEQAGGELVRLNMGPFRPYLVTHPDHVQHVLVQNQSNFVREGMFWEPLAPLLGEGILSDGATWAESRRILQPLFTARYVNALAEQMGVIINELIDETITPGRPFDISRGISAIVHPTIVRLFFGSKISVADIARLVPAYDVAVTAKAMRLVMPFVPEGVPMPGDRAFRRAIKAIDAVVYPRIREARERARQGLDQDSVDVVARLVKAREDVPGEEGERRIRDDLVAMHGASTETSATALTWVWPILDAHPGVAAKVYEEIDRVVGADPVSTEHLPHLPYLKMFVSELLRCYPPGWILPRKAVAPDVIGGVEIEAGSTVLLSPYLTHRLTEFWDAPSVFDPERFAPGRESGRHRYAYWPFGAGPHVCLGQHLFMMEAPLLIAGILRKYRPVVHIDRPVTPRLASSLRPPPGLTMTLVPAGRS